MILSASWELLSLVPFSQTTSTDKHVWFPSFKSSSFDSYRSYTCQKTLHSEWKNVSIFNCKEILKC